MQLTLIKIVNEAENVILEFGGLFLSVNFGDNHQISCNVFQSSDKFLTNQGLYPISSSAKVSYDTGDSSDYCVDLLNQFY